MGGVAGKRLSRYAELSRAYGCEIRPRGIPEAHWRIALAVNEPRIRARAINEAALASQIASGSAGPTARAGLRQILEGGDLDDLVQEEVFADVSARNAARARELARGY